jgi:DNA-binding transcriptional regulator PaaX
MTNGKQYVSRRTKINEYVKRELNRIRLKKSIPYGKFIGEIMNEFGVPERFVRDILTGYELTGSIKVDKKRNKIVRLK